MVICAHGKPLRALGLFRCNVWEVFCIGQFPIDIQIGSIALLPSNHNMDPTLEINRADNPMIAAGDKVCIQNPIVELNCYPFTIVSIVSTSGVDKHAVVRVCWLYPEGYDPSPGTQEEVPQARLFLVHKLNILIHAVCVEGETFLARHQSSTTDDGTVDGSNQMVNVN